MLALKMMYPYLGIALLSFIDSWANGIDFELITFDSFLLLSSTPVRVVATACSGMIGVDR
jgi:hypothetical protein